jgi:antitoxin (DNA-binding transcriptional repressor) of toxin-antitoxin stability system
MTVREVRLKWPEAERRLAHGGEIVVTRDGKPVARILPYEARVRSQTARFDSVQHLRWLDRFWKGVPRPSTDDLIDRDRAE